MNRPHNAAERPPGHAWVEGRAALEALRVESSDHGWSELFAAEYPHAGGPDHTALFIEIAQGFEIEIVAD